MKKLIYLLICLPGILLGQQINQGEYFFNVDPGVGNGTPLTVGSPGSPVNISQQISVSGLSIGHHILYTRVRDDNGIWSLSEGRLVHVNDTLTAYSVSQAEYFFDIDPGHGNGTPLTITTPGSPLTISSSISTTGLSEGFHVLFVRMRDQNGQWSLYEGRLVSVYDTTNATTITQAEYFFNIDPGVGSASPITVPVPAGQVSLTDVINTGGLTPGPNVLFTRLRDNFGNWSLAEGRLVMLNDTGVIAQNIVALEYFIDSVGAIGSGTPISLNDPGPIITEIDSIVVPSLPVGIHRLFVRAMDDKGRWSLYEPRDFEICSTYGPLSRFDLFRRNNTIYLDNNSEYVDQFEWSFGDGSTDTVQVNPKHTYANLGMHTVQLVTTNLCDTDTVSQVIIIDGIDEISPNYSSHTGLVSMYIHGYGFTPGADIKLIQAGQPDLIPDTSIHFSDRIYKSNFFFTNAPTGYWDLVINDPGGPTDTLFNAFEIQAPEPTDIWHEIIGPSAIRAGWYTKFQIAIGNKGNQTEYCIPVSIILDSTWTAFIKNPLYETDSMSAALSDSLEQFYLITDTINGTPAYVLGSYVLMVLGPGEIEYLDVYINSPNLQTSEIEVVLGNPLLTSSQVNQFITSRLSGSSACHLFPECVQCALDFLGFIPIAGCVVGIPELGCALGDIIADLVFISAGSDNNLGWNTVNLIGVIANTILNCVPLVPGIDESLKSAYKAAAEIAGKASGIYGFTPNCSTCDKKSKEKEVNTVASLDPNIKEGPNEITPDNFISGKNPVYYSIYFENADTASAPAAHVRVTDQLDTAMYDINSLSIHSYGFGDTSFITPSGLTEYVTDHDSVSQNIVLRIDAGVDTETGFLEWTFSSFDTDTMILTSDPTLGFLPPNVNQPEGEGYIRFLVELKPGYDHLDVINNEADIYFDSNAPIKTPVWTNTVDTVPPSSSVTPLPVSQWDSTFVVRWTGNDADAGIGYYNIYVSEDDSAYALWLYGFRGDSAIFKGQNATKYEFYSVAVDRVLNTELAPPNPDTNPDAVTTTNFQVGVNEPEGIDLNLQIIPNPAGQQVTIVFDLERNTELKIDLLDLSGRVIKDVMNGYVDRGSYRIDLPLYDIQNGMYLIRVNSGSRTRVIKFIRSD